MTDYTLEPVSITDQFIIAVHEKKPSLSIPLKELLDEAKSQCCSYEMDEDGEYSRVYNDSDVREYLNDNKYYFVQKQLEIGNFQIEI